MDLRIRYSSQDGVRRSSIPEDSRTWASNFIREHGAKTPAEIEAVVQAGHDAILSAIEGLTDEQASQQVGPDDWSVLQTMAHAVSIKQVIGNLVGNLAQGQRPPGIGPEWEEEQRQDGMTLVRFDTVPAAREAAESAHAGLIAQIRGLGDGSPPDVRFRHYIFGDLNVREWAAFQRVHDGDHTPQIERAAAAARR